MDNPAPVSSSEPATASASTPSHRSATPDSAADPSQAADSGAAGARGDGSVPARTGLIVASVLVAVLAAGWLDMRSRLGEVREEVAQRLRESDAVSREAQVAVRQAQESLKEMQVRLAQVEGKLAESQSQQLAFETLFQELSRNRDEWALAEIEQILTIASQQLQLAGNIQAALTALQAADARLARADRPQFIPVRRALARDIERLRGTPNIDLVGTALRLDQAIAAVDALPLAADGRLAEQRPSPAASEDAGFWRRLGAEVWGELRALVRVRTVESSEPALLTPEQAYFLRHNLKLRLLNARLALLDRNETLFRSDLQAATDWVVRYFDVRSRAGTAALATLKQLSGSGVRIEVPNISESLAAVRSFKVSRDRSAR